MDHAGRNIVYIISSMRAGSTLLKALIATRPDASDMPEIPFSACLSIESQRRTLVVKKPAYYKDRDYPHLPGVPARKIILIRNPYDAVVSLQRMNGITHPQHLSWINDELFLLEYWYNVYKGIRQKLDLGTSDVLVVRYEDLVENPVPVSQSVFQFIGSCDTSGTDVYRKPTGYEWQWGSDDGGDLITGLKVQKPGKNRENGRLLELIYRSEEIDEILTDYGYKDGRGYKHL